MKVRIEPFQSVLKLNNVNNHKVFIKYFACAMNKTSIRVEISFEPIQRMQSQCMELKNDFCITSVCFHVSQITHKLVYINGKIKSNIQKLRVFLRIPLFSVR